MTDNSRKEMHKTHFRRYTRQWVMQFLFQKDIAVESNDFWTLDDFAFQLRETELYELPSKDVFKKAYKSALKLLNGIHSKLSEVDAEISKYSSKSDWPIDRIDPVDKNIMRIAVYEMLFCNNIPLIVSINEAVEIGKEFGSEHSHSFINGILNSIKDSLPRASMEAVSQHKEQQK